MLAAGVLFVASVGTPKGFAQGPASEAADKYTWLEDIHGDKSMEWVKAENARTAAVMEKQKPFAGLEEDALKVLDSPDKLAFPQFRAGMVYNTWRDKDHVRGIVRRTTLESYLSNDPTWETVIDYDALGKQDKQSWVGHGLECLQPEEKLCLVSLSSGGEDAATLREFDLPEGKFVENGFVSPRGKQRTAWVDKDNLLIAREWGEGTMSVAGYPIEVKRWKRGTPLESAVEVFRGDAKDEGAGVEPLALADGQGHSVALIENSNVTSSFEHEYYLVLASGPKKLGLPMKANLRGLEDNQLLISLEEQWTPEGQTKSYPQGAVVSLDLEAVKADPVHLKPTVLFAPTAQEFAQQVATTKNHVLLTTLEHVQGRAYVYTQWERRKMDAKQTRGAG